MSIASTISWLKSPSAVAAAIFAAIVGALYLWGAAVTQKRSAPQQQQGLQYNAEQEAELRRKRALAIEKQQQQLQEAAAAAQRKHAEQEEAKRVRVLGNATYDCSTPHHAHILAHHTASAVAVPGY